MYSQVNFFFRHTVAVSLTHLRGYWKEPVSILIFILQAVKFPCMEILNFYCKATEIDWEEFHSKTEERARDLQRLWVWPTQHGVLQSHSSGSGTFMSISHAFFNTGLYNLENTFFHLTNQKLSFRNSLVICIANVFNWQNVLTMSFI